MLLMAKRIIPTYYRTTPGVAGKLKALIGSLQATELFTRRERRPTQEGLINAAFLWMASLDPAKLAAVLEPHLDAFEAGWNGGEPDAGGKAVPRPVKDYDLDALHDKQDKDEQKKKRKRSGGKDAVGRDEGADPEGPVRTRR